MSFKRKIPWTSQPQYPARVTNPAFTHAWNWGSGGVLPINAVKNTFDLINNSSLTMTPGIGGKGVSQALGGTNYIGVTGNPFATSVCTYLWVESATTLDANGSVILESRYDPAAAPETGAMQIRIGATGLEILKAQTAVILTAANVRVAGQMNVCAVTINGNNGRHAVFSNGRLVAEITPTVTYDHGTSGIGNGADADNIQLFGPLHLLAFAPTALPDAEMMRLTARPYTLFESLSRNIYVAAAATTFKPAWARANNLIGGGARV